MLDAAFFVSKRLQKVVAAGICLIVMQGVMVLGSCTPEVVPMAARVAIQY